MSLELAIKMLNKGIEVSQISEITSLPKEKTQQLKK